MIFYHCANEYYSYNYMIYYYGKKENQKQEDNNYNQI